MPSSIESIEDKKRRYSEELATYTLRQWETFHKQSAQTQAPAEQQRNNRKLPSSSNRARGGHSNGESKSPTRQAQIGKLLGKWLKGH